VPVYAHRAAILSRLLPAWLQYADRLDWAWNCDDHGWTAAPDALPPEKIQERVQQDRQHYAAAFEGFHTQGAATQALRELLRTCQGRHIPAVLVLMPEGSTFRRWYPADALTKIDALLDDLKRQYDAPRIDARDWIADEDFFDAHHLRAVGARRFSERLGREMERWLFR
jgi:hypothetical protein